MSKPVLLGGSPLNDHPIRLVKPVLPDLESLLPDIRSTLETGMVTKGRFLAEFERAVAEHLQVEHAVAVSSCTAGLALVYQALGLQGPVLVPSFTFMATVSALVWAGATPRFVDVQRETTNLSPAAVEQALTPDIVGIVAVHNFGNPADIAALQALAAAAGVPLIFDAAHGFGALYQGQPVGGFGQAECFSLSPTKLLIAGEGGIVATNDAEIARKIRVGREYGNDGNYGSEFAGLNARMAEYNALLGRHSLDQLEQAAQQRTAYAQRYRECLQHLPGIGFQAVRADDRCAYKDFSITVDATAFGIDRNLLQQALAAEQIDSRAYYDPPVHTHTAYQHFAPHNAAQQLEHTLWLAETSLSLPMHSAMAEATIDHVCVAIERIYGHAAEIQAHFLTI